MKPIFAGMIGFVLGMLGMAVLVAFLKRSSPPVPTLKPASAIQITLLPNESFGIETSRTVDIPKEKLDSLTTLLTPTQYYGHSVHEFISRLIATAVVTHSDGQQTEILIRTSGVNPALVSLDGQSYFYADIPPHEVQDGSVAIVRLVMKIANQAEKKE